MNEHHQIISELSEHSNPEKAAFLPGFFRAVPGGYGEGDQFIGVTVPVQRKIARKYYKKIPLTAVVKLLQDPVHEHRLTALFILVYKMEKSKTEQEQRELVEVYLANLEYVNNWDLVDSSADKILGPYLLNRDKDVLYQLTQEDHLWKQRIAIIATFYFIKNNQFDDTLNIAKLLLYHPHDLIHKAVGWMLREVGNRNFDAEYQFLSAHYRGMPRTMLRYAIEKFKPDLRQKFLQGLI